jgi:hypothetical protein
MGPQASALPRERRARHSGGRSAPQSHACLKLGRGNAPSRAAGDVSEAVRVQHARDDGGRPVTPRRTRARVSRLAACETQQARQKDWRSGRCTHQTLAEAPEAVWCAQQPRAGAPVATCCAQQPRAGAPVATCCAPQPRTGAPVAARCAQQPRAGAPVAPWCAQPPRAGAPVATCCTQQPRAGAPVAACCAQQGVGRKLRTDAGRHVARAGGGRRRIGQLLTDDRPTLGR